MTTQVGDLFGRPVKFAAWLAEVVCANEVLVGVSAVPDTPPRGIWGTQTVRGAARLQRVLPLSRQAEENWTSLLAPALRESTHVRREIPSDVAAWPALARTAAAVRKIDLDAPLPGGS